jgi:polyhydroxybutyrate depolymerase
MHNATSITHAGRARKSASRRRAAIALAVGGIVATCTPLPGLHAPAGAEACDSELSAGDQTITVDGASVPLYVPAGYGSHPVPLVLDLHGSSSSGLQSMAGDGIRAVADANGFAVIAPNGAVPFSPAPGFSGWAWNIPGVPLVGTTVYPPAGTRDDIAFVAHAIDAVADVACIDASRVYATGVSGGGRMASQLACDLSDRIAAIAPISGVRFPMVSDTPPHTVDCNPQRPVPVIAIHGVWDPVNVFADTPPPEAGSLPAVIGTPVAGSSWSYSAERAVERWAANNGCRADRPAITAITANIDEIAYRGCHRNADVVLFEVKNSGHMSPGHGSPALDGLLNPTNTEVDGTVIAWLFLSRYRLR